MEWLKTRAEGVAEYISLHYEFETDGLTVLTTLLGAVLGMLVILFNATSFWEWVGQVTGWNEDSGEPDDGGEGVGGGPAETTSGLSIAGFLPGAASAALAAAPGGGVMAVPASQQQRTGADTRSAVHVWSAAR